MKQSSLQIEKKKHGIAGTHAAKFIACFIEAMRNGGECEAFQ
jgi:hypothetical protein